MEVESLTVLQLYSTEKYDDIEPEGELILTESNFPQLHYYTVGSNETITEATSCLPAHSDLLLLTQLSFYNLIGGVTDEMVIVYIPVCLTSKRHLITIGWRLSTAKGRISRYLGRFGECREDRHTVTLGIQGENGRNLAEEERDDRKANNLDYFSKDDSGDNEMDNLCEDGNFEEDDENN
ncbi:hypothetical protein K469DRAFT_685735 [Zopfia rhizophila CBS 207.26]|uniref:Uncharacterized protein n=1 Tax=Zopfia rhizophila CBS 207.26 TaxID=1314779 RepID=A0A6A6EAP7_9PEZI|nr:hypothetical protein K469DRAFT_685735 [Zopfia rhizophila CBS 207.26]